MLSPRLAETCEAVNSIAADPEGGLQNTQLQLCHVHGDCGSCQSGGPFSRDSSSCRDSSSILNISWLLRDTMIQLQTLWGDFTSSCEQLEDTS
jgi:hypothetical protein